MYNYPIYPHIKERDLFGSGNVQEIEHTFFSCGKRYFRITYKSWLISLVDVFITSWEFLIEFSLYESSYNWKRTLNENIAKKSIGNFISRLSLIYDFSFIKKNEHSSWFTTFLIWWCFTVTLYCKILRQIIQVRTYVCIHHSVWYRVLLAPDIRGNCIHMCSCVWRHCCHTVEPTHLFHKGRTRICVLF